MQEAACQCFAFIIDASLSFSLSLPHSELNKNMFLKMAKCQKWMSGALLLLEKRKKKIHVDRGVSHEKTSLGRVNIGVNVGMNVENLSKTSVH